MTREAESHAEEDRKRRDLIEARNQADSMIYTVEKNVKEFGDKIGAAEKSRIEDAIVKLKSVMGGDDLEAIKAAQEELTQASHKLAEAMYSKTAEQPSGGQPGGQAGAQAGGQQGQKKDENVVDADFEEVK